jgi:hypothetical protein
LFYHTAGWIVGPDYEVASGWIFYVGDLACPPSTGYQLYINEEWEAISGAAATCPGPQFLILVMFYFVFE